MKSEVGRGLTADFPVAGRIPYTERAAMQDAHEAMQGDVVRALVELITNADDAYRKAGRGGPITVMAEHSRHGRFNRIVVRDQAVGMRRDDMSERLLPAGLRASGHEKGLSVRGLQGRGAKDAAAFGRAEFDSIKDGFLSRVVIFPDFRFEEFGSEREANASDYARLGVPVKGSGTQVTMFVERPRFVLPRHQKLADRLRKNYQLRDIMQDPGRDISLLDLTATKSTAEILRYQPPGWVEQVLEETLSIPGYPGSRSRLLIKRCDSRLEDDRSPSRDGGILVVGRHGIHDCSYFGLEGRSGALWFVGRLECPYIDDLQDQYDDREEKGERHPELNPVPIISRRRAGLVTNHPFCQKLKLEVDARFVPLVEAEEKKDLQRAGSTSEETRRRLKDAARELGSIYQELLREQELEDTERGTDDQREAKPVALEVVPDSYRMSPGESNIFSVRSWPELLDSPASDGLVAVVKVTDESVATAAKSEVSLVQDPNRPGRKRGTVKVTARDVLDATWLEITLGPHSAMAIIEVAEQEPPLPAQAPERLLFEYESCKLKVGGTRKLVLLAPHLVDGSVGSPVVRSNSPSIKCTRSSDFTLVSADDVVWYEAEIGIEGIEAGAARLRAEYGQQIATCRIQVEERTDHLPFDFELVSDAPLYESVGRAEWTHAAGIRKLKIYAGHPSLKRYFGFDLRNQNNMECHLLMAEILAEELGLDLLRKQEGSRGGQQLFSDVQSYDSRRRELTSKFLTVAHSVLVPERELEPSG